ncbi:unnamed protein product [Nesidiocoris tenuis]|uniref:Mre11 DNA-binding domain-containing protein n=1 Tax=Nesidiocoris tenuis TaxID=355587 RepID=A0A6H5GFB8_9HEMI|nr:unnamed protein product [Nesidiocoris tenuis]
MDSDADSESVANHALPSITPDARPDDIFKILVATDIHLGVHEKDPIRGDDSFNTFEEILLTAKEKDVDFILLGGDLFHDSKPTQSCYVRAISLIREHTMGDKPINMSFVADSKEVLHNSVIGEVNYQDPNQNVSFPIFSIHGNHDDPSGFGRTSALDVLSANGQLNYFGVCKDLTHITLKPILLRKGRSKLAVYGISHVRDERLSRLMASNQVEYEKPPNFDSWFKILVLHQNRVARAGTRHIHESQIPDFIDIVIWGHEHECLITPQPSTETDKNFYISQPGHPKQPTLPLIRLRLEVDELVNRFNETRFGQQYYSDVVANPADMVLFKTAFKSRGPRSNELIDAADLEDLLARKYLESDKRLETTTVVFDKIGFDKMAETIAQSQKTKRNSANGSTFADHAMSESDDDFLVEEPKPKRGRGRGRASTSRASTSSRGSRGRGSGSRANSKANTSSSCLSTTSSTLQTTLNFRSTRRLPVAEAADDWGDIQVASPRKKAKIQTQPAEHTPHQTSARVGEFSKISVLSKGPCVPCPRTPRSEFMSGEMSIYHDHFQLRTHYNQAVSNSANIPKNLDG